MLLVLSKRKFNLLSSCERVYVWFTNYYGLHQILIKYTKKREKEIFFFFRFVCKSISFLFIRRLKFTPAKYTSCVYTSKNILVECMHTHTQTNWTVAEFSCDKKKTLNEFVHCLFWLSSNYGVQTGEEKISFVCVSFSTSIKHAAVTLVIYNIWWMNAIIRWMDFFFLLAKLPSFNDGDSV